VVRQLKASGPRMDGQWGGVMPQVAEMHPPLPTLRLEDSLGFYGLSPRAERMAVAIAPSSLRPSFG
jgi:hypothetical protein